MTTTTPRSDKPTIEVRCLNLCYGGEVWHSEGMRCLRKCEMCLGTGVSLMFEGETEDEAFRRIEKMRGL